MILGRHPALIVGFLQAGLTAASYFLLHWTDAQLMGVVAILVIVGDIAVSYKTRDTLLGLLIGLGKAGVAALVLFGTPIDDAGQAVLVALLTAGVAMFQVSNTSPLAKGNFAFQKDYVEAA
jgi:hypothetical protein